MKKGKAMRYWVQAEVLNTGEVMYHIIDSLTKQYVFSNTAYLYVLNVWDQYES